MQVSHSRIFSHRTIIIALALVWFLTGLYLLLYSGIRVSNDEIYLFDSTESFARRGNFQLNYTFYLHPILNGANIPERAGLYEPLQSILAAPLFMIAQALPNVGMMHAVWVFNIVVTVLTAMIIYGIGLMWGYSGGISALTALLFGVTTLAFPYSSTFFREPLVTLFTLIAFFSAFHIRHHTDRKNARWIGVFLLAIVGMALTKISVLVVFPSLLILLLPPPAHLFGWLKRPSSIAIAMALLLLIILGFLFIRSDAVPTRFSYTYVVNRLQGTDWTYALESLLGYQISFGRSIWLYSPILLAGVLGFWLDRKNGGGRILLALLLAFILLPASFGVIHRQIWWSGTGWGPRYILPLVPILMLGIFPILQRLRVSKFGIAHGLFVGLALLSVGIQLLGMLVFVADYFSKLSDAGIIAQEKGLWTWQWSSIRQNLLLLDFNDLNIAWMQANLPTFSGVLAMIATLILLLCGIGLWFLSDKKRLSPVILALITIVLIPLAMGLRLRSIYDDPRFGSEDTETMQMIHDLDAVASDDDVIFIQNPEITLAFMNTFNTPALLLALPDAPGERHNPDVQPTVISDNLIDLMSQPAAALINFEALRHETMWLVMPYGPFNAFTIRPTERYMVEQYYPVNVIEASQRARAIQFVPADGVSENDWQTEQAYNFGDLFALTRASLPNGLTYNAGDVIPVSLIWQPIDEISRDYSISVQVGEIDTLIPLVQRDTTPQGQFGYTSRWQIGETYDDHHGLRLPDEIASGEYCLNIIVYYWEDGARLAIQTQDGESLGDVLCVAEISVE